jgi:hypothetical protein
MEILFPDNPSSLTRVSVREPGVKGSTDYPLPGVQCSRWGVCLALIRKEHSTIIGLRPVLHYYCTKHCTVHSIAVHNSIAVQRPVGRNNRSRIVCRPRRSIWSKSIIEETASMALQCSAVQCSAVQCSSRALLGSHAPRPPASNTPADCICCRVYSV